MNLYNYTRCETYQLSVKLIGLNRKWFNISFAIREGCSKFCSY
nr:MAG TPA: hypothetical protein [Caudoviricetes sp.]